MKKPTSRKVELTYNGKFRARAIYTDETGKRRFKSFTEDTQLEALRKAEEFEEAAKRSLPNLSNPTVKEVIEMYIKQKEGVLSPATIRGYKFTLHKRLLEIQQIPIRNLTESQVQKEIDRESKSVSQKTVRNTYGLLSAAAKNYDKSIKYDIRLPTKQRKIFPLPTSDELKSFLSAIEGTNFEIPALLAIYFGLRVSEIRGLRYGDIHNGKVLIHNAIVPDYENNLVEKDATKNETSTRLLNIPGFLLEKIEKRRMGQPDSAHIVTYRSVSFTNMMHRYCEKAGIRNIRFHDLRHVFASAMHKLNVPEKYAMQLGGWATPSTLRTVYQHTMADYVEDVNNQVNAFLDDYTGRSSNNTKKNT